MAGGDAASEIGPFSRRKADRVERVLRSLGDSTGLTFAVYVGDLDDPVRQHAVRLHALLPESSKAVLIAVSPNQRIVEVVTGDRVRLRLGDSACQLAVLSMTTAFDGGDLAGGLIAGATQLAGHAGPRPSWWA